MTTKAKELAESVRKIMGNNADGHLSLHEAMVLREVRAFLELLDMFLSKEGSKVRNGACAKVHEIAAKMGKAATRAEVLAACEKAGINRGTAATQYQKYLRRKAQ